VAVGPYTDLYQEAVHKLKFSDQRILALPMGNIMADLIQGDERYQAIDLILPVPASKRSLRSRGYNQAYLLAAAMQKTLLRPLYQRVLGRTGKNLPQHELGREARELNLRQAFQVLRPEAVFGQRILLVDDVVTTGSTCRECTRVLLQAGAEQVVAAAWASGIGY
jgi:ComF family protein